MKKSVNLHSCSFMYWLFSIVVKAQEPNVHEGCDTSQK